MAAYLETCFEEAAGDAAFLAKALGDIARAKGMSQVAHDAGLSRESLVANVINLGATDTGWMSADQIAVSSYQLTRSNESP